MNVYDQAHMLERAIRESEELKQFKAVADRVAANPEIDKMLRDFQTRQLELQATQMSGETLSPEMIEQMQQLASIVQQDALAAEYLQCQMRFSLMMKDVYDIAGEPAEEVMRIGG